MTIAEQSRVFQVLCAIPVIQQAIGAGEVILSALGALKDLGAAIHAHHTNHLVSKLKDPEF